MRDGAGQPAVGHLGRIERASTVLDAGRHAGLLHFFAQFSQESADNISSMMALNRSRFATRAALDTKIRMFGEILARSNTSIARRW